MNIGDYFASKGISAGDGHLIQVDGTTVERVVASNFLSTNLAGASLEDAGAIESRVLTVAATGSTETLDTSLYGVFNCTMDANCTFTFSNPAPSGKATVFMLELSGAFSPTFPASVTWQGGTEPAYSSPTIYTFYTRNGGTTWWGFTGGGGGATQSALWLPGTTGNYVSCPDAAGLDITGDITFVAKLTLDDWTPANEYAIISKEASGLTRSYVFRINSGSTGTVGIYTSSDGTAVSKTLSSTVATGFSDGSSRWIAATLDVNDGSGNAVARFWTSLNGTTWTQLGATVTSAGTTSIFANTAVLEIGARQVGATSPLQGRIHLASLRNGIGASGIVGGTEVARFDADQARGQRYRDAYGNVFTHNGSAWALMAA